MDAQPGAEEVALSDGDYLGGMAPGSESVQEEEEDDTGDIPHPEVDRARGAHRQPLFASTRELLRHQTMVNRRKQKRAKVMNEVTKPKRMRFTDDEDRLLLRGVRKYGRGQWAWILKAAKGQGFHTSRTGTSLRDRYRTLHSGGKVPSFVLEDAERAEQRGRPNANVPDLLLDSEDSDADVHSENSSDQEELE